MKMIIGGVSNKKRAFCALTVLLLLGSLLALGTAAYQKNRGSVVNTEDYLYLVYGENSTEAVVPSEDKETAHNVLLLGKDYDSNRTDAIICVSFKADGGISTLQIPRDTYVTDGDYKGRINGLMPRYRAEAIERGDTDPTHTGIKAFAEKIYSLFGIKCQSYVFMDSAAVAAITDTLGGVTVDIPMDIDYTDKDREIDLHLKAGKQTLDGKTASQFLRYRQGYPQADIGRINAQKLYAAAMIGKLQSLSSVKTAVGLADTVAKYVKTDLTPEEIVLLATRLCTVKGDEVLMYTMPGDGVKVNGGSYYGVFCDKLCEVLEKGFETVTEAGALDAEDFSSQKGGYRDTDGVRLSQVLEDGLTIPVYAD